MTDIGIEFAVTLDQLRHTTRIIVQRCCQFADFIIGKVRCQRLGLITAGKVGNAFCEFRYRTDDA